MSRRPPGPVRRGCAAAKAAVLVTALALAAGIGPGDLPGVAAGATTGPTVDVGQRLGRHPGAAERQIAQHDCSVTGFAPGTQPTSALVRSARGTLRFVDFDTGWRIYTRHGAAKLVAVCLDAAPQRGS